MNKTTDEKTTIIEAKDSIRKCLKDDKNLLFSSRRPLGWVEIYEKHENLDEEELVVKSNLVVWQGREWVNSRIFNQNNAYISPILANEFISWFGLGSGGASLGDPLNPITVTNSRTELFNPIIISTTDSTLGDYRGGGYYKKYFDSIQFQTDPSEGNKYLITKIEITIGNAYANGSGTQNINEAGLYVASSGAYGYSGAFHLFSMLTFPTIVKDSNRQLKFLWYIYT